MGTHIAGENNLVGMSLGVRVKHLRKNAGLTQKELADKVGVDQSTISDLENGVTQNPSASVVASIAKALGTSPEFLLQGYEPEGITPILRADVMALAIELQKLPPEKLAAVKTMLMAFGPAVSDEQVAKHIRPAPKPTKSKR